MVFILKRNYIRRLLKQLEMHLRIKRIKQDAEAVENIKKLIVLREKNAEDSEGTS